MSGTRKHIWRVCVYLGLGLWILNIDEMWDTSRIKYWTILQNDTKRTRANKRKEKKRTQTKNVLLSFDYFFARIIYFQNDNLLIRLTLKKVRFFFFYTNIIPLYYFYKSPSVFFHFPSSYPIRLPTSLSLLSLCVFEFFQEDEKEEDDKGEVQSGWNF